MSAVERIQSAIDKLEAQRAKSQGEFWYCSVRGVSAYGGELGANPVGILDVHTGKRHMHTAQATPADADLIVTLHDTIDAQLSILSEGLIVAKHWEDILDKLSGNVRTPLAHALLIADAIVGPQPH